MEIFLRIVALDREINRAEDEGRSAKVDELYERQEALMNEVERLGLRKKFDEYIVTMN